MRKLLLTLFVVAVVGLLLFGCAPKNTTPKITKIASTPKVAAPEPVAPAEEPAPEAEPEVQEEPAVEPKPIPPVTEPAPKTASVPVTQEELDELKQGIQGIETEDLGGLSQ